MSWGAIIVSILKEKMDDSQFVIPECPEVSPAVNRSIYYGLDELRHSVTETLLFWDKLEKYFHVDDHLLPYRKDRDTALEYWCCLSNYYTVPFFKNIQALDTQLDIILDHMADHCWSDQTIRVYSDFYILRQNLISHIRYIQSIHPLMLNFSVSEALLNRNYEIAWIPAKNYVYSAGKLTRTLCYTWWKIKLHMYNTCE